MSVEPKKIIISAVYIVIITLCSLVEGQGGLMLAYTVISFLFVLSLRFLGVKWGFAFAVIAPIISFICNDIEIFVFIFVIIFGNGLYVLTLYLAPKVIEPSYKFFLFLTPVLGGALLKYYVQFFSGAKLMPYLLMFNEDQMVATRAAFSSLHLLSTLIGGIIGVVTVYIYNKVKAKKIDDNRDLSMENKD